jgi:hypothetical protein
MEMEDHGQNPFPENLPGWDRAARIALGVALFLIGAMGLFAEPAAAAIRVASLLPLVSAAMGWCPVRQVLGWSSRRRTLPGSEAGSAA